MSGNLIDLQNSYIFIDGEVDMAAIICNYSYLIVLSMYDSAWVRVIRPTWYRDRFVEWAEEISRCSVPPYMREHRPVLRANWCGLVGCPYSRVTERISDRE